jgi:thiol-disulfide isomerase/thioredoxin
MPDMLRLRSLGIFVISLVLISFLATTAMGQHHTRLTPPRELLEVIDPDDLGCVQQTGLDKSVTIRPIRLAADKNQQLLIRGSSSCLCGAQNCPFWIYRKTGNRYERLLTGAGSIKVRAGQQTAKGYRDVISESHASAVETIVRTYRYDGSRYQPFRCINRAYYDDQGKYTERPIDRPCEAEAKDEISVSLPADMRDRELTTVNNRVLKLSDYSGKMVVLNVLASWCAPCRMMLPDLIRIKESYKSYPIEVLGLMSKKGESDIDEIRRFFRNQGVNFQVIWATDDFLTALLQLGKHHDVPPQPFVVPQTFVIDQSGTIRRDLLGFIPDATPQQLRATLDRIGSDADKPKTSP